MSLRMRDFKVKLSRSLPLPVLIRLLTSCHHGEWAMTLIPQRIQTASGYPFNPPCLGPLITRDFGIVGLSSHVSRQLPQKPRSHLTYKRFFRMRQGTIMGFFSLSPSLFICKIKTLSPT